eukprot:TRINITY_DN15447_c0_g1_i1.p1 TRINITY_DN15447_c0_g1~~TRINITY_DN15447_c0_g1_i1.p1  ORF type:complete len:259 (-),score=-64.53 TRINITY_DN15447_c0_g1_i1:55-831(-)
MILEVHQILFLDNACTELSLEYHFHGNIARQFHHLSQLQTSQIFYSYLLKQVLLIDFQTLYHLMLRNHNLSQNLILRIHSLQNSFMYIHKSTNINHSNFFHKSFIRKISHLKTIYSRYFIKAIKFIICNLNHPRIITIVLIPSSYWYYSFQRKLSNHIMTYHKSWSFFTYLTSNLWKKLNLPYLPLINIHRYRLYHYQAHLQKRYTLYLLKLVLHLFAIFPSLFDLYSFLRLLYKQKKLQFETHLLRLLVSLLVHEEQ